MRNVGDTRGCMKVEEFRNLSDDQLREKANECLANVDDLRYAALHAAKLLQAQLYMNEINTRNDEKIAERDEKMAGRSYKLEIWVIILIGLELLIGLGGIAIGCREGNQQVGVLQEMKKSTAATATLLQGQSSVLNTMNASASATATAMDKLQKAQDASLTAQRNSLVTLRNTLKSIGRMNDALDQELNLAFAVAINVTVDNATKHMTLANLAKTSVYVWGAKFGDEAPGKFPDERFIPPGGGYIFFLDDVYKLAAISVPRSSQKQVPLELYVQSADGREYVMHGFLLEKWEKDELNFYPTMTGVKLENWPAGIR